MKKAVIKNLDKKRNKLGYCSDLFLFLPLPTEPSGIFVKNVIPGSAADHNGQIHVHDKIVAVSKKKSASILL